MNNVLSLYSNFNSAYHFPQIPFEEMYDIVEPIWNSPISLYLAYCAKNNYAFDEKIGKR